MQADLLQYDFIVKGFLGALFASITAGIAGTYIVTRKMVFLSGGITHASFGGIGIGYFAGMNPVAGAALFGILSAFGIEYLSMNHKIREDSAIGILWAFGMATGIIFIYLTPGYAPNLMSYLFGSILTVTDADVAALGIMSLVLIVYFAAFYRTILYISFDESFARTYSPLVNAFKYVTTALVALTIVLNIRMAGVVLVLSLFTIPPNIAMLFTRVYSRIIVWSVISGFAGTAAGYIISYYAGIPVGATIIFTLVIIWLTARMISRLSGSLRRKAHLIKKSNLPIN
ncbi:MAG TPA: metal ABC transporter permease [Bacteroidales bacterium]|nr:metal ABC transporter permease [Bacteroidales bacterium]HPF02604.1 metal ABC transporter permease [Bacteroidales bacterium]HPJ59822.1 metal ABC transporter permease [Bacteroidales bacterium]HRW84321.1 metal ABC transporter permease [Bacteroidales bacterium]